MKIMKIMKFIIGMIALIVISLAIFKYSEQSKDAPKPKVMLNTEFSLKPGRLFDPINPVDEPKVNNNNNNNSSSSGSKRVIIENTSKVNSNNTTTINNNLFN